MDAREYVLVMAELAAAEASLKRARTRLRDKGLPLVSHQVQGLGGRIDGIRQVTADLSQIRERLPE